MRFSLLLGALLSAVPIFGQIIAAPYDPSQFTIIGDIDSLTLNNPLTAGPLSGGIITVDGIPIIVPDNSIVTLPATAVAWPELFTNGVANLPGTKTWQATVFGNRVKDQYIAGLVYIAQNPLRQLQGFITSIDYTTGHFTIAGPFNPAGYITCVLNDPLGVFGPKYTANPLWSLDPVNPAITAFTGFPMCIPRTKNRPTFGLTQFTFPAPGPASSIPNPTGPPDANFMAPLIVGDYVTINGNSLGSIFEVNFLIANVGYYTAPGTQPSYMTPNGVNIGITFPASPDPPETRATVFTTDPSTPIQWFFQDVDPCTGVITERNVELVQPQNVAPVGRAVFRMGTTPVTPPTRNVGFRAATGMSTTGNNLTSGLFIQPIFGFVFPEITTFGANVPPLAFDKFPFLALGSGPYTPGNVLTPPLASPPVVGQLKPFPMNPVPAPTVCPPPGPATSTSSSAIVSPTTLPPDVITIVSATSTKNRGGSFTISVIATTSSLTAKLSVSVAGVNPIGTSPMTNLGNGLFSLTMLSKGLPSSVTVTSSQGGTPVSQVV